MSGIKTKYKIGDVLKAKMDIRVSVWATDKIKKGALMEVLEILTVTNQENETTVTYELGYYGKRPYFIKTVAEKGIADVFTVVKPV